MLRPTFSVLRLCHRQALRQQTFRTVPRIASAQHFSTKTYSPEVEQVVDQICNLSLSQVSDVVSLLNEKLDLPEAPAMGAMPAFAMGAVPAPAAAGEDAAAEGAAEEKTTFDVKITEYDAKDKIKIIKEVRAATSLGLKEAKALVEALPVMAQKGLSKEDAEAFKEKLVAVGAKVELV